MLKRAPLVLFLLLCFCTSAIAQQTADGNFQQLEAQSQAIKSQILDLEAELSALEQDVRYPQQSRWTVFVTAAKDVDPALSQIELQVAGRVLASHEYTPEEQAALSQGGAQRLYIGNLSSGKHQIFVRLTHTQSKRDKPKQVHSEFTLNKPAGPRILELHWQPDAQPALRHNSIADTP